jgi:7-carboxy-7-deazaguanine synthase (Cx14CxxC type)
MKGYKVKEIFYTLQGEGAQSGRPAVFCRFSGCNLWSGREKDRSTAICRFCDTDFVGMDGENGGKYPTSESLAEKIASLWPDFSGKNKPYVVCTGGEPLLQMDEALVQALHEKGFEIAVETNGTILPPEGLDWICVSPKAGTDLILVQGNELKLVFPQKGAEPELYTDLEFDYFFLQPMDGPLQQVNTTLTLDYCKNHPQWRLSLQSHKILQIP